MQCWEAMQPFLHQHIFSLVILSVSINQSAIHTLFVVEVDTILSFALELPEGCDSRCREKDL